MTLQLESFLACPRCRAEVTFQTSGYFCKNCATEREVEGRIIFTKQRGDRAIFDSLYEQMQIGNQDPGVWEFCYNRQAQLARRLVPSGSTILDIGCGPELVYEKAPAWTIIGVDPSLPALKKNATLDYGVWGTAEALPLKSASIDAVFCFYSIHHMVGERKEQNEEMVARALSELNRVTRSGGLIIVFDMSPWYPAWILERLGWNVARDILGEKLDMFFWRSSAIQKIGRAAIQSARFEEISFPARATTTFPPVFNLPWFRIPRFLYPMDPKAYVWTVA